MELHEKSNYLELLTNSCSISMRGGPGGGRGGLELGEGTPFYKLQKAHSRVTDWTPYY